MYRGMHHPLDVAGGVLVGIGAVLVLLFACRAAAAPRRARAPARSRAAVGAGAARRWRHEGRGRRPRREALGGGLPELRRVLAAARRRAIRSGTRCRRPSRRPSRCGGRSTRARSSCSPGAATGRCAGASACSPARGRPPRGAPGRHGEPVRHQPRHPDATSRARSRSGCAATRRRLDVGRFERRALRGHGRRRVRRGDDPRRRRPQGAGRPRARTSGAGRATCAPRRSSARDRGRRRPTGSTGRATCVLLGNVGDLFGGVEVFPDARPDDGVLELGVVTAEGLAAVGADAGPHRRRRPEPLAVRPHHEGEAVKVELDRKVRYELDGGDRSKVKSFKVEVEPGALSVCVPRREEENDDGTEHERRPERRSARPQARGRATSRAPGSSSGWPAPGSSRAASSTRSSASSPSSSRSATAARRPTSRARSQTIAQQPFGKVLLVLDGDRPRRLRDLAARARRDRPRAGGPRRHEGADRRPGRAASRTRCCASPRSAILHRRRAAAARASPDKATGGVLGLARRPGARGPRRADHHRRRPRAGLQGRQAQVPREVQDRADGRARSSRPSRRWASSATSRAWSCSR